MILAALFRRSGWVVVAAAIGAGAGWYAGRTVPRTYASEVTFALTREQRMVAQASVITAAIDAILRQPAVRSDLEKAAGGPLRRLDAAPVTRDAVAVSLEGSSPDGVLRAAGVVRDRVSAGLGAQAEIVEREVAARIAEPVLRTTRPYWEVPIQASIPPDARQVSRNFVAAGLLAGAGLAVIALALTARASDLRRSA